MITSQAEAVPCPIANRQFKVASPKNLNFRNPVLQQLLHLGCGPETTRDKSILTRQGKIDTSRHREDEWALFGGEQLRLRPLKVGGIS